MGLLTIFEKPACKRISYRRFVAFSCLLIIGSSALRCCYWKQSSWIIASRSGNSMCRETLLKKKSGSVWKSASRASILNLLLVALGRILLGFVFAVGFYFLISSPPLHLVYEIASPAGPSSVYIQGKKLALSRSLLSCTADQLVEPCGLSSPTFTLL